MATIYIVEDDVNIREIERYALKNSGYEVEEFESGESLFKRLERAVPSLLLLDIMLPDEDGLEILGKLRANKNTAANVLFARTNAAVSVVPPKLPAQRASHFVRSPR